MGMVAFYRRISSEQLLALQSTQESVKDFFYSNLEVGVSNDHYFDIGKNWQGLHFLLTGTAYGGDSVLSRVVLGGTPFVESQVAIATQNENEEDDKVELDTPITFLTPQAVKEASEAMLQLSEEELESNFNSEVMEEAEIYPGEWYEEESLENLLFCFREVRLFFQQAADAGDAILFHINI